MSNGKNTTRQIKKQLIEVLEKNLGVVQSACNTVGIHRSTFYSYYNNDPKFRSAVDEIEGISLDFAESQLFKQIKDGNITAIIFYLKTKGKKRGYVEKTEIDVTENPFLDAMREASRLRREAEKNGQN